MAAMGPARAENVAESAAPVVVSTGLIEGQLLNVRPRFTATVRDDVAVVWVELWADGARLVSTPVRTWTDIPFWPMLSGVRNNVPVDITIRAFDAEGNVGEATTSVFVDSVAPTAAASPKRESYVHSGPVPITLNEASADIAYVVVYETGDHPVKEIARVTAAPWRYTWNATENGLSPYFKVVDLAGNSTIVYTDYRVDDHAPTVEQFSFNAGAHGWVPEKKGGWVTPKGSMYPAISGDIDMARYEWSIDGKVVATDRDLPWDEAPRSKPYTVAVRVWDFAGNVSRYSAALRVDAAGPSVISVAPGNNALVRGKRLTSVLRATDAGAGVWRAELSGGVSDSSSPYTSGVALGRDGKQTLTWSIYDHVYNKTVVKRTVIVDNVKPKVAFTKAPKNKAKVKGTVKITASASDRNGVARVELLVNGKVVAKDTKVAYRFSLNTKKYGKKIKVQLRAYDRAGNLTKSSTRIWYRR